jgi:hypothetical protein
MADNQYYDEVEEGAYERSAQNHSVAAPESRDLWQSTNISTDGNGPLIDDVAPVFAQARANALANPVTADSNDDLLRNEQAEDADTAQERADALRSTEGYAAPTGAEAGQFDDPALKDSVPGENFSSNPAEEEGEEVSAEEAPVEEAPVEETPAEAAPAQDNWEDDVNNSEANPPESTPEAPTSNEGEQQ